MKTFILVLLLMFSNIFNAQSIGPGMCTSLATGGFPTPPAGSTIFNNLQNATGTPSSWTLCNGTCAGSTVGETGTSSFTQNISSPSLSGSSAEEQSAGTTNGDYWNTLYTIKIPPSYLTGGVCSGVTGLDIDKWIYLPSGNNVQAIELDPDLFCTYSGTAYKYMASLQCRQVGTGAGYWYVFNTGAPAGSGWTETIYPCNMTTVLTPNTWHHIQLHVSTNQPTQQYTYGAFWVDGGAVSTNLNMTYSAKSYSPSGVGEVQDEQQIDGTTTPQNNIMYIDIDTLTVEY